MNKKFCPKCGSEKGPFIGSFCRECYLADHKPASLPDELVLESCKRCGKMKWRGRLVEQSRELLREVVEASVKLAPDLENPKLAVELSQSEGQAAEAEVHVNGIIGNSPISLVLNTSVRPKTMLCDPCMRLSSYYHEAILQLRYPQKPTQKDRSDALQLIEGIMQTESRRDPLAGIVDVKDVAKGIDFLIGSKHAAKAAAEALARQNNAEIARSYKVIGVDKSGKEKKRYTFCVRIR